MTPLEERILEQIKSYIDDEMTNDDIYEAVREHTSFPELIKATIEKNPDVLQQHVESAIENLDSDAFEEEIGEAITKKVVALLENPPPQVNKKLDEKTTELLLEDIENYELQGEELFDSDQWKELLNKALENPSTTKKLLTKIIPTR